MRSIAFGLAAALLVAAFSPAAALAAEGARPAAPKASAPKPANPKEEAKKHDQGKAETPPLIQQTGINCTLSDAYFVGEGTTNGADGKPGAKEKIYEVACQEGLGYMILAPAGATPMAYDCLAMSVNKPKSGPPNPGGIYCKLVDNDNPLKGIGAIVAKAGVTCSVAQGHYVGSSQDGKTDVYEVACADGTANIIQSPRVGSTLPLVAGNCIFERPDACPEFMPKAKMLTALGGYAAPAARDCQVTDARFMGTIASNKNSYFELACAADKPGFVLQLDANSKYVATFDCARASTIAGGCTLSAAAAAQTDDNAIYAKLAREIGYACAVKGYKSIGINPASGREVVELSCSDHPDGAITMLPVDKGQTGEFFNCVRAEGKALKCVLTEPPATYSRITTEVAAAGKTCQVTNARSMGSLEGGKGDDVIEIACAAGNGFVVEYGKEGVETVKGVTPCALARGIGDGCKLSK